MKLNRMICPRCGHESWTDCTYISCDSCQTVFYAAESLDRAPRSLPLGTTVTPNGWSIHGSGGKLA